MSVCDDCFNEFVHPLFHELMGKNERFEEQYGPHARWDWDHEAVTLTFSDPVKPTVRVDVSVVAGENKARDVACGVQYYGAANDARAAGVNVPNMKDISTGVPGTGFDCDGCR